MRFEKILVNPQLAQKYLNTNSHNRTLRKTVVDLYATQMKQGKWKIDTGEAIKISKTGHVLDGQHRLSAIIKANVSVYLLFVFDLDESVFDVIDTGKVRSSTDIFKIDEIKNYKTIPSVISMFNLLQLNRRVGLHINEIKTNAELLVQYQLNSFFWQQTATLTYGWYRGFSRILGPAWIGGFYAHFCKIDTNLAGVFMDQLCTGKGVSNDIILTLRNILTRDSLSARKMNHSFKMSIIIKAWNVFVGGKEIKILKYDPERESFPVAISPRQKFTSYNLTLDKAFTA